MAYYLGIGPEKGTVVEEDQAFEYALERGLKGTHFQKFKGFREVRYPRRAKFDIRTAHKKTSLFEGSL